MQAKSKHQPVRTCLVCRKRRPKRELLRLVVDKQTGEIVFDASQKAPGRGAYVCRDGECVADLFKPGRLARLGGKVSESLRDQLEQQVVLKEVPREAHPG